jgi:hypothetical protein
MTEAASERAYPGAERTAWVANLRKYARITPKLCHALKYKEIISREPTRKIGSGRDLSTAAPLP